jgi:hypothetical protein
MFTYLKAAFSIAKSLAGIQRVSREKYMERISTCYTCPAITQRHTNSPRCGACNCYLFLKAMDKTQTCPVDRPEWKV